LSASEEVNALAAAGAGVDRGLGAAEEEEAGASKADEKAPERGA
jgi:hypothetical protein